MKQEIVRRILLNKGLKAPESVIKGINTEISFSAMVEHAVSKAKSAKKGVITRPPGRNRGMPSTGSGHVQFPPGQTEDVDFDSEPYQTSGRIRSDEGVAPNSPLWVWQLLLVSCLTLHGVLTFFESGYVALPEYVQFERFDVVLSGLGVGLVVASWLWLKVNYANQALVVGLLPLAVIPYLSSPESAKAYAVTTMLLLVYGFFVVVLVPARKN